MSPSYPISSFHLSIPFVKTGRLSTGPDKCGEGRRVSTSRLPARRTPRIGPPRGQGRQRQSPGIAGSTARHKSARHSTARHKKKNGRAGGVRPSIRSEGKDKVLSAAAFVSSCARAVFVSCCGVLFVSMTAFVLLRCGRFSTAFVFVH